jgi:hypothetical protein
MNRATLPAAIAVLALALLAGAPRPAAHAADGYEEPPVLRAADRLPAELLTGEHHRVDDRVVSDGFMNHFVVHSDFGDFEAESERMLGVRVREVYAIARLRELSRGDAFAGALKRAVTAPIGAVARLADQPVETLKGIPAGVVRKVRGLYYKGLKTAHKAGNEIKGEDDEPADEATAETAGAGADDEAAAGAESVEAAESPVEEEEGDDDDDDKADQAKDAAKSFVGYNSAYRELAKSLQVDPYTSNPVLRDELQRLASAAFAAGLGFKMVVPVPYLIGVAKDVSEVVWDTPRGELERLNNLALRKMGVSKEVRLDFFANDALTPTCQTLLVEQLERLAPLRDRSAFVELAVEAEEEEYGWMIAHLARVLASYHQHETPIARLVLVEHVFGLAVVGVTADDRVVIPMPFDHVTWRPGMDGEGPLPQLAARELWLAGTVSPRAQAELEERGFAIHSNAIAYFDRIEAPAPASQ